jgi:hypothetical protein
VIQEIPDQPETPETQALLEIPETQALLEILVTPVLLVIQEIQGQLAPLEIQETQGQLGHWPVR